MSADLRARIADALTAWVLNASRSAEASRIVPIPETVHANSLLRADVVMTVIQPELDAKDAEVGRMAIGHESLKQASIEALERAEQAEAELHALRAAAERVRASAQAAKPGLTAPPIDCSNACFSGACDCSANWRPVSWDLDPAAILAALDQAPAAEQDGGGR